MLQPWFDRFKAILQIMPIWQGFSSSCHFAGFGRGFLTMDIYIELKHPQVSSSSLYLYKVQRN
jgi:hypothetical protein